jgi:hypothetical protein
MADGLAIAVEFVSFGDVAGDTDSRSSELITQAKVVFKGTARGEAVDVNRQVLGFDPDLELLVVAHVRKGARRGRATGAGQRAREGYRHRAQGAGRRAAGKDY